MKLLIVDDEAFAVQGILDSLDWSALPFDEVLTALGMEQAQKLFQLHSQIDVLLCDIEMPTHSGIELAEWVKHSRPDTVCLFLTCHDEFDFAQRAIKLECFDYILKPARPAQLTETLLRAAAAAENSAKNRVYRDYGKLHLEGMAETGESDAVSITEDYIRAHISENISVPQLAQNVYISHNHLTRLFRKKHGMTVVDYIIAERMRLSRELLDATNLPVSEIASRVGYADYSYFIRLFKKTYGKTPREYKMRDD